MANVSVAGLDELRKTLLSLDASIASKNGGPVRSALARGARRVRDVARAKAPVKTGRLQRAIYARRDRNPAAQGFTESYVVGVSSGRSRDDEKGAFYWRFVEFKIGKEYPNQPFVRPAFEENKAQFRDFFASDLTKAIAAAVRRARKNG
jgi:HK97 gp10 family phage protein